MSFFTSLPLPGSQRRTVPSKLLVASRLPSRDQATAVMACVCPSPADTCLPVCQSQTRRVPGALSVPVKCPTAKCLPSGDIAAQRGKSGVGNERTCLPVAVSQTRISLSQPPVTACLPSGASAAAHTPPVCPGNRFISLPVGPSYSRMVRSAALHSTRLPSLDRSRPQPPVEKVRTRLPVSTSQTERLSPLQTACLPSGVMQTRKSQP